MKKYKISVQYLKNYVCYAKKHRDMWCEYQDNSRYQKKHTPKYKIIYNYLSLNRQVSEYILSMS